MDMETPEQNKRDHDRSHRSTDSVNLMHFRLASLKPPDARDHNAVPMGPKALALEGVFKRNAISFREFE
jgi:hypothetical protein